MIGKKTQVDGLVDSYVSALELKVTIVTFWAFQWQ